MDFGARIFGDYFVCLYWEFDIFEVKSIIVLLVFRNSLWIFFLLDGGLIILSI
jgi:hypothetical protein